MKTLIIYDSRLETQNTKKIAVAMANAIQADIVPIEEVFEFHLEKYDLVGFGSGIFFNKFSKTLRQYIENLQPLAQTCFVFYTSGMKECNRATSQLTNLLELKQRKCLGVWHCQGRDVAFTLFKKSGGFNKNRPDNKDCEDASKFVKDLILKFNK